MSKAFGQQTPTMGEDAVSWQTWTNGAGTVPTIFGDADWGKLVLDLSGEEGRSAVYDLTIGVNRTFTVTANRYGTGAGSGTLLIRGAASSFTQDDETAAAPVWEIYTVPISHDWRYIQICETTYTVLPQNCLISPDVPLETFEDDAEWTAADGSVSDDTTNFKTGSQSVKLTTDSGAAATMTKTVSWAAIGYEFFEVWIYLHDTPSKYTSITFSISSTTDFSKKFSYTLQPASTLVAWPIAGVWSLFRIPLGDMTNTGSEDWANTMIRIRLTCVSASGVSNVSFDGLAGGYKRIPTVLFYHDDGYIELYSNGAFQHMRSLGIRGNIYVTPGTQKSGSGVTTLTPAMYQEIYAAGWNITSHGMNDYATGRGMGDMSLTDQEYNIGAAQIYIRTVLGCPGYERHFSYNGSGSIQNDLNGRTAATNAGALTVRGGYGVVNTIQYFRPSYLPPGEAFAVEAFGPGTNVANIKTKIDYVITHGQNLNIGCDTLDHGVLTTAEYIDIVDYVYTKWQAGLIYPITVDELYRLMSGPVVIGVGQLEAASSWTLPALPVDNGFEANDFVYWDNKVDTASLLSTAAGAALNSTNYGMNIHCASSSTTRYLQKGIFLPTETDIAYRFYFDPNSLASLDGSGIITRVEESKTGYRGVAAYFTYSNPDYMLRLGASPDSGTISWGTAFTITDAPHYIEVQLHRASTDGNTDGWAKIYVDGSLKDTKTGIANYNLFIRLDRYTTGYFGGSANATGDFFIDEIKMNRTGTLIGA